MENNNILRLPNENISELRKNLREKLKKIVFYKVSKVLTLPTDFISARKFNGPLQSDNITSFEELNTISPQDRDRIVEEKYREFQGITSNFSLRGLNNTYNGSPIMFHSTNYSQLDLLASPKILKRRGTQIPPKSKHDTIAGIIRTTDYGLEFAYWFVCSEQFMNFWTLLFNNENEKMMNNYFGPPSQDGITRRSKLFSGDRLMTNEHRKWYLKKRHNNMLLDPDEERLIYTYNRGEFYSSFVHVYTCLVLMFYYGELPSKQNVPNNLYGEKMLSWDIPNDFVRLILFNYSPININIYSKTWEQIENMYV